MIEKTIDLIRDFLSLRPNTVLMVGAYVVGKERIFKAIAESLDTKIWGDERRVETWRCLEDEELLGRLVQRRARAQVQVITNGLVSWAKLGLQFDSVRREGGWSHVLGVKPTGWSHSRGERSPGTPASTWLIRISAGPRLVCSMLVSSPEVRSAYWRSPTVNTAATEVSCKSVEQREQCFTSRAGEIYQVSQTRLREEHSGHCE